MATKNIQLKDGSGNLLMPKTDAKIIENAAVIEESADTFSIVDELGNQILRINKGVLIVKDFSSNSAVSSTSCANDLEISDESGNRVAIINNGNIKLKSFDSSFFSHISEYKGKTLSILGDSISTFGTPDQNNAQGTWTYPGNRCRYPQNSLFTSVVYQW
jgi:hypothetical protein